jgi:hypothetical protein
MEGALQDRQLKDGKMSEWDLVGKARRETALN